MSLRDEVNRLCDEGKLYSVPQTLPGLHQKVFLYGSGLLKTLVAGVGANAEEKDRIGELAAFLDYIMDGHRLDLRPLNTIGEPAQMALLEPIDLEVWEIRSVEPPPAYRIFGSFIERDVFVALTWAKRKDLGGRYSKEWKAAIQEFREEWELYFGTQRPFSGSYPDDYLTNSRVIERDT